MNCRKVSHLLSAYMDGELPGIESLQIREHLSRCADCKMEYEDLLGMKRLVGRLRVQTPRADLAASILRNIRIDEEIRSERGPYHWLQRLSDTLRTTIVSPQTLGIGVGLAAIAVLFVVQTSPYTPNGVQSDGKWDHSLPPAAEFMSGVNTSAMNRFIPPVRSTNWSVTQPGDLSSGASLQGFLTPPTPASGLESVVWHPH